MNRKINFILLSLVSIEAWGFNNLKNGFEMITSTYLIPLSKVVAGAALLLFALLSYWNPDVYKRHLVNVIFIVVLSAVGLTLINSIFQAFFVI